MTQKDIIEAWTFFRKNAKTPSELKRLEALDFMKEAAIVKLNSTKQEPKKPKLSEKKLWEFIRKANWSKDHDYNRINKYFLSLPASVLSELKDFYAKKADELATKFNDDWLGDPGIPVSDDSWSDLIAECVGRGEKFYNKVTVKKLQKMANEDDYHENFGYSFH